MKCEYIVTQKLFISWAAEGIFKGIRLLFAMIFCLLAGFSFGMILRGFLSFLFFVLMLVFLYFAFFRELNRARKRYNALADEYGGDNWKRTITLEKENIVMEERNVSEKYTYADIRNACERKDHFALVMRSGEVLRIYKSGLEDYTADECWKIIERKMDEAANQKR